MSVRFLEKANGYHCQRAVKCGANQPLHTAQRIVVNFQHLLPQNLYFQLLVNGLRNFYCHIFGSKFVSDV
jgi:hypothetical protein